MNRKNVIEVNNISKSYGDTLVIDDISFNVKEGEFLSIVGTSGCGKTTLLNILSDLDKNYSGKIAYYIDRNKTEYMLQESALFPWLNVLNNASLGCIIKHIDDTKYVSNLLDKYGLKEYKEEYPSKLSGGMKQRVSLIRSISTKPEVLFLDEPFGALDFQTRLIISNDIYKFAKENKITVILITHDISEAASLSDRVIVLSKKPSKIKKIINIDFSDEIGPIKRRESEKFTEYYKLIQKELDLFNES